jgi:hypothetical protein
MESSTGAGVRTRDFQARSAADEHTRTFFDLLLRNACTVRASRRLHLQINPIKYCHHGFVKYQAYHAAAFNHLSLVNPHGDRQADRE